MSFAAVGKYFDSGWAFGLNRNFGSVYSVSTNFGFHQTRTVRFISKLETDRFGFGFIPRFFGSNRTDPKEQKFVELTQKKYGKKY
jgi:hypothetical protein